MPDEAADKAGGGPDPGAADASPQPAAGAEVEAAPSAEGTTAEDQSGSGAGEEFVPRAQYDELHSLVGRLGREVGDLRKQVAHREQGNGDDEGEPPAESEDARFWDGEREPGQPKGSKEDRKALGKKLTDAFADAVANDNGEALLEVLEGLTGSQVDRLLDGQRRADWTFLKARNALEKDYGVELTRKHDVAMRKYLADHPDVPIRDAFASVARADLIAAAERRGYEKALKAAGAQSRVAGAPSGKPASAPTTDPVTQFKQAVATARPGHGASGFDKL